MGRRRVATAALGFGVVTVAALAVTASLGLHWNQRSAEPVVPAAEFATTPMKRETLVAYSTVDAQISYGAGWPISVRSQGVVTWLPAAGKVIRRGETLLRVNDTPIVLLYGDLPAYRQLTEGTEGNDVREFEENLSALGYRGFTVDRIYSKSTVDAVKRWQKDLGLPESGTVEPDRVLYATRPVRIAGRLVRVGATVPADVLTGSGTRKVVTAEIETADAAWATAGTTVSVLPASGKPVPGKITSVSEPSNAGADTEAGTSKIKLVVSVENQKALPAGGAGISIRHTEQERRDVLTAPVTALLALAEGGYGVEVVADGTSRIVAVEVGMFSGGRVEVSGAGLEADTLVRVPK
ncbi:peptidoglycan-binding protein [Actinoplanes flavus]|uniref:Peptidoglycan-binding protein n=1 Tax=Actinoplanes flavus TaxID=2820290 RepID=A0ABS3UZB3_9ACTN|nr:peptidoglycan-binding protein [Actinoplanes flavus]MBO3743919.1 peptidoglycan-binding protein [Actinoplanes flavus]